MTRYLVTGGAGFIGSNIVDRLVREENEVVVVDDFSTGKRENLAHVMDRIQLIETDICDRDMMRSACKGVDCVFHQAAIPSVPRSVADPLGCNRAAVDGTLSVLLAARDEGVSRVVGASSSSVYGESPELPKHEGMPVDPLSPYAVGKLTAERYAAVFTRVYGLETVSLRYFNVYGPRQDPHGDYAAVIPKFISLILSGKKLTIYGDGSQSRDFTFVEDVVEANLLASLAPGASGRAFNIGGGKRVTLNEVVAMLGEVLGTEVAPEYAPVRAGDILHSLADISAASDVLGYAPGTSFREGLVKTAAFFRRGVD